MTASIRSIYGIDGSRRLTRVEDPTPEPVVIPEPPEPRATRESREPGPKHRRPSRLQLWWRPERPERAALPGRPAPPERPALPEPARSTTPHVEHVSQQPLDITRTILELTDERYQELSLRLDRLTDEVAGLSRALDERAGEVDRARWLLGDKLSTLVERLDYD